MHGMKTRSQFGRSLVWIGSPELSLSWTKLHSFLAMRELG